jgi:outer membrane protein assembly factor BamB
MLFESSRTIRWKLWLLPAAGLAAVAAAGLVWAWTAEVEQHQVRIVRTMLVVGLTLLLETAWLSVWILFLSRMRRLVRLACFAVLALVLAGAVSSVRISGVSGDTLPQLAWRWAPEPGNLPLAAVGSALPPGDAIVATADDYPQFLGPSRDGIVRGPRLARDWASRPPQPLWRQPIGAGWSAFAVVGGHAVTQEQRGGEELVTCYDLRTGEVHWSHADRERFDNPLGGLGPRATPAIAGGKVFALGATGRLNAIDLRTGELLWSTNIVDDARAVVPTYGVSASPLVLGDVVVVSAGGGGGNSLVAYDRRSGERRWSGGDGPPAYSSPLPVTLAGVEQILVLNGAALSSHDPADGSVFWSQPWPGQTERVSQPVVVSEESVFLSTGYGVGGKLFRVIGDVAGGLTVELVWESLGLKAKFTNVVHREGFLYGLDDGILVCLDVANGRRRWKAGRYGHGQILLAGELIVILAENGEVALVEARPDSHVEVGRFPAIEGKSWAHPALAGRHLVVRNDREAACYELPLED